MATPHVVSAPPTIEQVTQALAAVNDPEIHRPITELGMVKHVDVAADGSVLVPLDEGRLRADLARARRAGRRAVAIVLLHAWRHPQHESRAAAAARALGFEEVSVSHEL